MADKKEEVKASVGVKASKAELKTNDHVLVRDVTIGDKLHKKGTSYALTEQGRKYFKSLKYIN